MTSRLLLTLTAGTVAVSGIAVGAHFASGADADDEVVYVPIEPCRLLNTRPALNVGPRDTPLPEGEAVVFGVHEADDVNSLCEIPDTATAINVNATIVNPTRDSDLRFYPADATEAPNVSTLNFVAEQRATPNGATITLDDDGEFAALNKFGTVDLVMDITGYFRPSEAVAPPPTVTNPQWGVMLRNTIGPATATLRGGPTSDAFAVLGATPQAPPFGVGSLQLLVPTGTDKVDFGNEVDFVDDEVGAIDDIGFHFYATGESNLLAATNVPVIRLEIDPNGAGTNDPTDHYASLVFVPADEAPDSGWTDYVDATSDTAGTWFLAGNPVADDCGDANPCTWSELTVYLGTADTPPTIHTVAVGKGRDTGFQGAVDGLRINDTVYDFEPLGVIATPAS